MTSLDKALDILELLSRLEEGFTLAALATELGVPKTTVHRLVSILRRRGYVSQVKGSRAYFLGLRIFALQNLPTHHRRLISLARSHLRRLARELQQSINLAVLDPADLGYWCHSETPTASGIRLMTDGRAPLHCSALGKMLLASLDEHDRRSVLQRLVLEPKTPRTITVLGQLEEELQCIATRGYAVDDEEDTQGVRCVAAPIRATGGRVVAAVSVTALSSVITPETITTYASKITKAAADLSVALAYGSECADGVESGAPSIRTPQAQIDHPQLLQTLHGHKARRPKRVSEVARE